MKTDDIKKEIAMCDQKIDESKKKIKELSQLEDHFLSINDSFEKCLTILNKSMKGRKVSRILDESFETKNKCINDSLNKISQNKDKVYAALNESVKNRERLEKEYKEQSRDK